MFEVDEVQLEPDQEAQANAENLAEQRLENLFAEGGEIAQKIGVDDQEGGWRYLVFNVGGKKYGVNSWVSGSVIDNGTESGTATMTIQISEFQDSTEQLLYDLVILRAPLQYKKKGDNSSIWSVEYRRSNSITNGTPRKEIAAKELAQELPELDKVEKLVQVALLTGKSEIIP